MDSDRDRPAERGGDEEWFRDLLRRSGLIMRTSIAEEMLLSEPWSGAHLMRLRRIRRGAFLAARRRTGWRRRAKLRVLSGVDGRLLPTTPSLWWRHGPHVP